MLPNLVSATLVALVFTLAPATTFALPTTPRAVDISRSIEQQLDLKGSGEGSVKALPLRVLLVKGGQQPDGLYPCPYKNGIRGCVNKCRPGKPGCLDRETLIVPAEQCTHFGGVRHCYNVCRPPIPGCQNDVLALRDCHDNTGMTECSIEELQEL